MKKQYIEKSALMAEIDSILNETNYKPFTDEVLGERKVCRDIKDLLNTLEVKEVKEEPVSETLEEAAFDYAEACKYDGGEKLLCVEHFKAGAQWQALHSLDSIKGMEEQAFLAGVEAEQINKSFSKDELLNRWRNKK